MANQEILKTIKRRLWLLLPLLAWFVHSCNFNGIYDEYHHIEKAEWHQDSLQVFNINIQDSMQVYDFSFNVRNEGTYGYNNLWLFVQVQPPVGEILRDTVELTLAEPSGKWLGSGLGDIYDKRYPFRQNVYFPNPGEYKVVIQHGMRTSEGILKGIRDIGIRVEYADRKQ